MIAWYSRARSSLSRSISCLREMALPCVGGLGSLAMEFLRGRWDQSRSPKEHMRRQPVSEAGSVAQQHLALQSRAGWRGHAQGPRPVPVFGPEPCRPAENHSRKLQTELPLVRILFLFLTPVSEKALGLLQLLLLF